jgi:PPOX class probable F420-dependent enzyme
MTISWSEEHLHFIEQCRVARLSTGDASGEIFAVPICYAMTESSIVTPIDEKPKRGDRPLKRARNIQETGRATVLFDYYEDENWDNLRWVMVRGSARLIGPDDGLHARAVSALRARYAQYQAMNLEAASMIVIEPERMVAWGFEGRS